MKRKFQVAVIIVNYNTSRFTIDCVHSILAQSKGGLAYQIIVVDNASKYEDFVQLEAIKGVPNVQIVRSRINTGFSLGNMLGVQAADADYYLFLNNDTLLLNDFLQILYDFAQQNPDAGICSGQMHNQDGEKVLNFGYLPTIGLKLLGTGFVKLFSRRAFPKKRADYTESLEVGVLNGSALFVRATVFEEIGGFDTNYFLYCEEEDLAFRVGKKGFKSYLVPAAQYQHFISQSTATDNKIRLPFLREFYISFLYYFRKNHGGGTAFVMRLYSFLRYAVKVFKHRDYGKLALFILFSGKMSRSMRFKQAILPPDEALRRQDI